MMTGPFEVRTRPAARLTLPPPPTEPPGASIKPDWLNRFASIKQPLKASGCEDAHLAELSCYPASQNGVWTGPIHASRGRRRGLSHPD